MSNPHEYIGRQPDLDSERAPFATPQEAVVSESLQINQERLINILSLPEELRDEVQEQLRDVATRAYTTTVNPHDRHALAITTGIVKW